MSDLDKSLNYSQIGYKVGVPQSTAQSVIKRYHAQATIEDAKRSGWPSKIMGNIKLWVERTIQEYTCNSLNEITERIRGSEIGRTTINKVTKQLGFELHIPWKILSQYFYQDSLQILVM